MFYLFSKSNFSSSLTLFTYSVLASLLFLFLSFPFSFLIFIEIQLIYSVVLVSGIVIKLYMCVCICVIVVQSPSCVQLFVTPWAATRQACGSLTISRSLPKFMSIASVIPSSHLILWCPLLHLPSVFPSIRVSCSHQVTKILELQLQHQSFQQVFRVYFPLDWLVWSLCYLRDFQESSPAP